MQECSPPLCIFFRRSSRHIRISTFSHSFPSFGGGGQVGWNRLTREQIGGVITLHHLADRDVVADRCGKDGDDIDAAAGRHAADIRHQSRRRLCFDEIVEGRRTRPEPAVSVPSAKLARPEATATAEPELERPDLHLRCSQRPHVRAGDADLHNWRRAQFRLPGALPDSMMNTTKP